MVNSFLVFSRWRPRSSSGDSLRIDPLIDICGDNSLCLRLGSVPLDIDISVSEDELGVLHS